MTFSSTTLNHSSARTNPFIREEKSRLFIRRETANIRPFSPVQWEEKGSGRKFSSEKRPAAQIRKCGDFVARIRELIENNIDDEHYSIARLCRDAGTSRAQLHRNLIAATGLSASKFIRRIRLEMAKVLLLNTDLYVYQVAIEVGFSDYRYFSRVFSQSYQQSPKDFRQNMGL